MALPGSLSEKFGAWERIEVAGFIPQTVSQLGPFGTYTGDARGFANGPIPVDKSRFYGSLDFGSGRGYFRVNPTHPVDGPVGDAWPISFNPAINWGFRAALWQHTNYIALEASGDTLRLRWSIAHGDRRTLSGLIPTEITRVAFDGYIDFTRVSDDFATVEYHGDCFPSIEAYIVHSDGRRIAVMQMASKGPEQGIEFFPGCDVHFSGDPR